MTTNGTSRRSSTVSVPDSPSLTGSALGREDLLETSLPGVYAAGDVRAGSAKRCAAAVGEGAMVVQSVHAHLRGQRV